MLSVGGYVSYINNNIASWLIKVDLVDVIYRRRR
jgi:hypothetical protein